MRVALGSTSYIKKDAVCTVWKDCQITQFGVSSGLPDQPIGKAQTLEGARNRCVGAMREAGDGSWDMAIGIENGMWQEVEEEKEKAGGKWVDGAGIVINDGSKEHVVWSDTIDIPATGHPRGPNNQWSVYKDPHSVLTQGKRPRARFLSDAISQWKEGQQDD